MGKKKEEDKNPAQSVINTAQTAYESSQQPSPVENQMNENAGTFMGNYNQAAGRQVQDYSDIMERYNQFNKGLTTPKVSSNRPAELGESYGYMREAMPGYRDFASTGGYSGQDVQELRARGMSPIRAAYGNTMREIDRARSLGGGGTGAPNYIAAMSRAQRDLPEQLANAATNVNAGLADSIRQGKQFGLQGMTGTGQAMGGLSSAEAGRDLQAQMANQQAEQNTNQMHLAGLGGQASLYGSSPGMAGTFGNQALGAYQNAAQMQANRQNYGLGLMNAQLQGYGAQQQNPDTPWLQTALGIAGTAAPLIFASDAIFSSGSPASIIL